MTHVRLFALLALAAGCQAPETPVEPVITELIIQVVEFPAQPPATPLAGAKVTIQQGSSAPLERVAAADGKVVVPVELARGPVSVTASAPAHSTHAMVDVTKGPVTMYLVRTAPDSAVELSGTFSNKLAAGNTITLTSTTGADSFQSPAGSYTLPVASGKPFSLVGLEVKRGTAPAGGFAQDFLRWFQIDRAGMTADTMLDIDVGAQTALTQKTGTLELTTPGGATGPLADADFPYVFILLKNGNGFLGAATKMGPNAAGTGFEGDFGWVQPNGVSDDQLRYRTLISAPDGSYANHSRDAVPPAALTVDDFLLPPVVTLSKAQPGTTVSWSNWSDAEPGDCALDVYSTDGTNKQYELMITTAERKSELVVPELPASVRTALAGKVLEGRLECRKYDSDQKGYRSTGSRWIDLDL
jgi:hypothetical protein